MKSYSTDFEISLNNALEVVFPNVCRLGCFFHYAINLKENQKKFI